MISAVKIALYILGIVLSFLFGVLIALVSTPFVGTLVYEDKDGKDIYTIMLNKDPADLKLRDGQYASLKFRKLNTSPNDQGVRK